MFRIQTLNPHNHRQAFTGPLAETLAVLKAEGFIILNWERI